jgi:hypothetical protein
LHFGRGVFGRRRCSSRTVVLLAAGLIVTPRFADAASLDKRELEARRDFAEAHYEEALHLFAELFAQTGDLIYLRNIARCYQKMRRPTEAIATFHDYLAKAKVSEKERREIDSFIREMEELERELAGAARNRGGGPDTRTPPHPVDTPPNANETPGAFTGVVPAAPPSSPPAVAAMSPAVPAGPSLVVATPESPSRRLQWAGIASGTAGVVMLAVGLGFGLATRSTERFVEHDYSPARDAEGRRDETLQWIGYLAGGAALATGATLFLVGRRTAPRSGDPKVQATVGPQGFRLGMRF